MIRTDLDRAIEATNKRVDAKGVLAHIYGESKPTKNRPVTKRKKRVKVVVPDGFPKGTVLNKDQTLTLPDGRLVRKISEARDEQIQTA